MELFLKPAVAISLGMVHWHKFLIPPIITYLPTFDYIWRRLCLYLCTTTLFCEHAPSPHPLWIPHHTAPIIAYHMTPWLDHVGGFIHWRGGKGTGEILFSPKYLYLYFPLPVTGVHWCQNCYPFSRIISTPLLTFSWPLPYRSVRLTWPHRQSSGDNFFPMHC